MTFNWYSQAQMDTMLATINSSASTLSSTVSGHTTSIGNLNTSVGTNTTSIGTLNSTVAGHTTSITTLNTTATRLSGQVFDVTDPRFGAVGDGVTDDRAAIQAAIDAAASVYNLTGAQSAVYLPGKTFGIKCVPYYNGSGNVYGLVSLMLKSGVHITGEGTLFAIAGNAGTGTFLALIRSADSGISNCGLHQFTIDGNSSKQTASSQCSNVMITGGDNIEIERVQCKNANGQGIQVVGVSSAAPVTNLQIHHNYVNGSTSIGIQVSQLNGMSINDNIVTNCTNNCIDIYNDNGTNTPTGGNWTISNNICSNGLTGVFPETSANGVVSGNMITNCSTGIHINRINGAPANINITGNTIVGGYWAVEITGDTSGITIQNNVANGFTTGGIHLGGGGANCSYIQVGVNTLYGATNTTPRIWLEGNQIAFCHIAAQLTRSTDRGSDIKINATTVYQVVIDPTYSPTSSSNNLQIASGGTFNISVPGSSAGTVTVHGSMGGAWHSVWHGIWVTDASGRCDTTQLGSDFTTPGQAVASVVGQTSGNTILVTAATSGSVGYFDWSLTKVTA